MATLALQPDTASPHLAPFPVIPPLITEFILIIYR
jgi:hypothetical protein